MVDLWVRCELHWGSVMLGAVLRGQKYRGHQSWRELGGFEGQEPGQ